MIFQTVHWNGSGPILRPELAGGNSNLSSERYTEIFDVVERGFFGNLVQ
jgi:hypothetical protein